jgi:hypothetical protein
METGGSLPSVSIHTEVWHERHKMMGDEVL